MGVSSKPWYRKSRDAWYVQVDGKQIQLAKGKANRAAARQAWLSLMSGEKAEAPGLRVSACFDAYIAKATTPKATRLREQVCSAFLRHVGEGRLVIDLKHEDLRKYIKPAWAPSTARTHIKAIMAAINLAVGQKQLAVNPLAGFIKPAWTRRREVISPEEVDRVVAAAREPFRSVVRAMLATGCRPGEICGLQIRDCDLERGTWTVANKTETQTGEAKRTIYLADDVVAICRERIGTRTSGPVFLNKYRRAWTTDNLQRRFIKLRKKLGLSAGVIPYATRHRFASDAINKRGMDSLVVAKLMGHKNPMMLAKTYYHDDAEALRAAANKAAGNDKSPADRTPKEDRPGPS